MSAHPAPLLLHFRDIGQGVPVVVLHGLFGSARNWQLIANRLAGSFRVITVDMRNHGDSPHAADMAYEAMAADVMHVVEKLGLNLPVLLGHSMGGKVAMTAALMAPTRWRRLVIVDTAPVTYSGRFLDLADAMLAIPVASLGSRAEADTMLKAVEPDPAVRSFLLHNLVARDDGYTWRIGLSEIRNALSSLGGFPAIASSYPGPTLFLRGEKSPAIRPEHHAPIFALFPRAAIVTIAGAGHWPHTERPDAFLEALTAYLAD